MALKPANVYAAQLMLLEGIPPSPSPITSGFYTSVATVMLQMMADADVSPLPAMVAPTGGGPVTGLGKLL